ncbi:unnamed protein product [Vitrella brassicaformis CCMP3155]|uniref:RPA43 OB domain-containing protein n=2 Tax=Vitrella brassicaformis TaxID=1169539 RepID=A0A0G4FCQ2_VITBC|nr:unnamed protein product [Vitrella brassicaformis CCMP3155]|eukprot:CEM10933.1 unnamed protein product [Vitrella brassicaformis CCMP3155]
MDDERPWEVVTCRPIKRSKVVPFILRSRRELAPHLDARLARTDSSPVAQLHNMASEFHADGVDVDSFVVIEAKNTVQLEARFLNEPLTGIQYFLSNLLHRYLPEFRGVWMAHHSARALESCGYTTANCADNTGYTLVDVQLKCLVWQPVPEDLLLGRVHYVGSHYIAITVHGLFPAFVSRQRLPKYLKYAQNRWWCVADEGQSLFTRWKNAVDRDIDLTKEDEEHFKRERVKGEIKRERDLVDDDPDMDRYLVDAERSAAESSIGIDDYVQFRVVSLREGRDGGLMNLDGSLKDQNDTGPVDDEGVLRPLVPLFQPSNPRSQPPHPMDNMTHQPKKKKKRQTTDMAGQPPAAAAAAAAASSASASASAPAPADDMAARAKKKKRKAPDEQEMLHQVKSEPAAAAAAAASDGAAQPPSKKRAKKRREPEQQEEPAAAAAAAASSAAAAAAAASSAGGEVNGVVDGAGVKGKRKKKRKRDEAAPSGEEAEAALNGWDGQDDESQPHVEEKRRKKNKDRGTDRAEPASAAAAAGTDVHTSREEEKGRAKSDGEGEGGEGDEGRQVDGVVKKKKRKKKKKKAKDDAIVID